MTGSETENIGGKSSNDPMIGKTIAGKYQILSLLGEGGMSAVYKARQLPINKIVAVKVLLAHLSNDENSKQRFIREAKAAGQFSHPNVVSVFDFGFENKYPFLVMDYLEGRSLDDILRERGFLPYEEALILFGQMCDGLGAAHKSGVIHRDIKPSNIVIQKDSNGESRVRIVDFGIAKMIDAESQHLTKTGEIFGSPLYMSPEQCEGVQLDNRSDIYSLGVVFYETLSGKRPFTGQSALETMWMHVEELPPTLQKLTNGARIPLSLENIVFKMMAKDREKRYARVEDVRKDLETFATGQSTALSGNLLYVSREISRKSKILVATAATLLLGVGLVCFSYSPLANSFGANEFEQGKVSLQSKNAGDAVAHLQRAVQAFRAGGDKARETKALAALIEACQGNEKYDALRNDSRKRRQELVMEVLSSFDLGSSSIDSMIGHVQDKNSQVALEPAAATTGSAAQSAPSAPESSRSVSTHRRRKSEVPYKSEVSDSLDASPADATSASARASDLGDGFSSSATDTIGIDETKASQGHGASLDSLTKKKQNAAPSPHPASVQGVPAPHMSGNFPSATPTPRPMTPAPMLSTVTRQKSSTVISGPARTSGVNGKVSVIGSPIVTDSRRSDSSPGADLGNAIEDGSTSGGSGNSNSGGSGAGFGGYTLSTSASSSSSVSSHRKAIRNQFDTPLGGALGGVGGTLLNGFGSNSGAVETSYDQSLVDDLNAVRILALQKHIYNKVIEASDRIIANCSRAKSAAGMREMSSALASRAFAELMLGDVKASSRWLSQAINAANLIPDQEKVKQDAMSELKYVRAALYAKNGKYAQAKDVLSDSANLPKNELMQECAAVVSQSN